ncbi:adenylate/guanylate cyclase domain-containing protein [Alphaproteobacteria bacterium]|nr:adenylate/guanylate cyclase domain-containing protein [Alphaproteobacteria bacterium]
MVGSAAAVALALLYSPRLLAPANRAAYDRLLASRPAKDLSKLPVIVDIDADTVRKYGQYPLPRYVVADLTERLGAMGAAAIGLDIDLTNPDLSSPAQVEKTLLAAKNLRAHFSGIPEEFQDYDAYLAAAVARTPNVVLGAYPAALQTEAEPSQPEGKEAKYTVNPGNREVDFVARISRLRRPSLPLAPLAEAASVGAVSFRADFDGIVRRVPLLVKIDGKIYPSMALEAFRLYAKAPALALDIGEGGVESVNIGPYLIPVGNSGDIRFPFPPSEQSYDIVSAGDIMAGSVPEDMVRGRIAFVGSSALARTDTVATPSEGYYPTLSLHAATVDAITSQNGISVPRAMGWLRPLGVFGLIALLAFWQSRLRLAWYGVATAAAIALVMLLSYVCIQYGYFVSPVHYLAVIIYMLAGALVLAAIRNRYEKHLLYNAFSRYVSPSVVKKLTRLSLESLEGEEQEVSIMFTDIRRFTSISENMLPQDVVRLLNSYFSFMVERIRKHDGTLDKFIGDGTLSFWNAPARVPDHQKIAVRTALEMQNDINLLNRDIAREFGITIQIGIAIHCQAVFVGNIGSSQRMNYTIIGDGVNLTARLEPLCKVYGAGIIVSEHVRSAASGGDEFEFRFLDNITVYGRNSTIKIYEPMTRAYAQSIANELQKWQRFIVLYSAMEFAQAAEVIAELLAANPASTLYALYEKRVKELLSASPAAWTGIWHFGNK